MCPPAAPAADRTQSAALVPRPGTVISVTCSTPDRPEQARNDWLRARLCQRDRAARRARHRPPRLPHPGSRWPTPPPAARTSGPVQQPSGGSCQRDPQRVGDQKHQQAASAPRITIAFRPATSKPRGPCARPGTPRRSMPTRLGRPGHRPAHHVPPQRFTQHHNQRRQDHGKQPDACRPQEPPYGTTTPHTVIVPKPASGNGPAEPQQHPMTSAETVLPRADLPNP